MEKKEQITRDYFFDNYRFILILTVVIAHIISPLAKINAIKYIYRYIYIFHMPGMIFISGYFSKSAVKDGKLVKNKILNYTLLYLIFQTIYTILNKGKFSIFQSQYGLWYIQVLIVYMFLLPFISRIKKQYVLIISLLLGLLVGIDSSAGHVGSLSRILVFLPFFMLGYYCKREYIEKLFKTRYYILGVLILIAVGIMLYVYMDKFKWILDLFSGKISYKSMKLSNAYGILVRFIWYIISFLMFICVMLLTPKRKAFFSKFGERTLQIFCLHLMICIIIKKTNLYILLKQLRDVETIIIVLAMGIGLTFILSLKVFSYPFKLIMNHKFKYLLKGEEEGS